MDKESIDWELIHQEVFSDMHRHEKMRKMNKATLIKYFDYKKTSHRTEGSFVGIGISVVVWLVITGISMCGCV